MTQKAHAALRWLIERQSFRSDTQVIVAWAVNAVPIPQIVEGTDELLGPVSPEQLNQTEAQGKNSEDIGQEYALKLKKKIAGYKALLKERDDIVVMSLDSATPGRMAVPSLAIATSGFVKAVFTVALWLEPLLTAML